MVAIAVLSAVSSFAHADGVSFIDNLVANHTSFAEAQKEWDRMDEGERNQARQYEAAMGYKYTIDLSDQNNNNQAAEDLSHENRFAQTGTNRNWTYSTGVATQPQVTQGAQQAPSMMKTATVVDDQHVNAPAQVVQKTPMTPVIAVPEKITKNDPTGKPIIAPVMPAQSVPVPLAKTPGIDATLMKANELNAQRSLIAPPKLAQPVAVPSPNASAMKVIELDAQRSLIAPPKLAQPVAVPSPNASVMKAIELNAQRSLIAPPKLAQPVAVPSPNASAMKASELNAQHKNAVDKAPSVTTSSYRAVVIQKQSALVKVAKPATLVKQTQPVTTYANNGVSNQARGPVLAASHAVSNIASRQQSFEQSTNSRFSDIEKQQSDDRKEYRSGIAGVGAIAGLHYVENTDNSVAVGAADFKDSQGYALGYRHKFADNAAATISAADTSNGDAVVAVSAAVGW